MFTRNPTACCVGIIAMLVLCDARLAPADVQAETLTDSRKLSGGKETRPEAPTRFAQADRRHDGRGAGFKLRREIGRFKAIGPHATDHAVQSVAASQRAGGY